MQTHFNATIKDKLQSHFDYFKVEAKKLRLQLNSYKREFVTRDSTFLKLRNAIATQEFTFSQMRRYLNEQNIRMVYKIMGLTIPKPMREKFQKGGADFSDYFPVTSNRKATHTVFKCTLGFVEVKPDPTNEQL